VWVAHPCPTLLTLGLELPLTLLLGLLSPLLLGLLVWVGHSCPTPLTLGLELPLTLSLILRERKKEFPITSPAETQSSRRGWLA
jgi:hypothetical protein